MATIGKIRKHSGLLIGLVGLAIVAFVLQDYLGSRNGSRESDPVAEVYGEDISYVDFSQRADELKNIYSLARRLQGMPNFDDFSSKDLFDINNSVYMMMVRNAILDREYDKLGLAVSNDELAEYITGRMAHPLIQQLFGDKNGFNPNSVKMYIESIDSKSPEEKGQWSAIERYILEERMTQKYVNLISKAYYMPKAFLDRENVNNNKKYVTTYTFLPYSSIDDSKITVTDEELENYYEEHKH